MFVVQCFPRVGFVEKKIEQVQIVFLQWRSPSVAAELPFSLCSAARRLEESVYDGTRVKQVFQRGEGCGRCAERARGGCAGEARSVQSTGIRDLLPSGKIRTRCNRPLR